MKIQNQASTTGNMTSYQSVLWSRLSHLTLSLIVGIAVLLIAVNSDAQASMSDRVLVIVNEDVITQTEFDSRRQSIVNDLQANNQPIPPELNKQLLDTMVSDRLQVQEAQRRGIDIEEEELQQAVQRFAAQQNLTVAQLKDAVEQSGQPFDIFTESVRDSMIMSRFSDYYARSRVKVPAYEIDGWLAVNKQDEVEYEIAQLLIKGGDGKRQTANQVIDEISSGMSFEQAVLRYSESQDAQQGGVLGWRKPEQLPIMFLDAVKDLQVGGVSNIVDSPNGFHILKLLNIKGDRTEILQSKVRHILISAESKVAKSQATKRALELRQRILGGEDFDAVARVYSDDSGSAALGGELGWVSPGEMVAGFEQAFTQLSIDEVSQPVETRFGVHIIRVEDRRKKNVTEQVKRARAENILRRQRAEREFGQWVRELMEGAYIKYVAEPV